MNACAELNCLAVQIARCNSNVNSVLKECLGRGLGSVFGIGFGIDRLCVKLLNLKSVLAVSLRSAA